ncbi:MAG: trimethylamine methyltransferase family protein [Candidatus Aminicenantes bacterium]|nr:trimethylamine methyltransferase family protein [Candidatus Aminicenantes bacterium]
MRGISINDRTFGSAQFARISEEQCRKIHWASLEILERTGLRLHDEQAVSILKKAGALVSGEDRVRIPSGLVEKAFSTAPKRFTLYNRHKLPVMPVEGYRCFYGTGSDCLNIVDHRTNSYRPAVLRDVRDAAILSDALENIDFVMSFFLPSDVERHSYDLHQMEVMLNNTTKPIVIVTHDQNSLEKCVAMAESVAGGPEALRQNPFVTCYINVTTGLRHNQEALQKLIYLAGKGLPLLYIPIVSAGLTAPVTLAGAVASTIAGVLGGLVLSQLVREGTPFVMPAWGARAINMKTASYAYFTADDKGVMAAMAHYFGLPMFDYGGFSDSKIVDQQAGAEAAASLLYATLNGGNIIHDLGFLEAGLIGSLVQLALCNELIDWMRHALGGVEISEETLALDLIDQKGPDGQFLDDAHTFKHFRKLWTPKLIDQKNYDRWAAEGQKTLADRTAEKVEKILAGHKPEHLPSGIRSKIHDIVRA